MSRFTLTPIEGSTLLTDGKHLFYDPVHVLESYKAAREIPVRDYLHIVMHCVFRHMYMDPSLNRPYWDLACDIAVENVITDLNLQAVTTARELQQARYISAVKKELKYVTAEKIYSYLRQSVPYERNIKRLRVPATLKETGKNSFPAGLKTVELPHGMAQFASEHDSFEVTEIITYLLGITEKCFGELRTGSRLELALIALAEPALMRADVRAEILQYAKAQKKKLIDIILINGLTAALGGALASPLRWSDTSGADFLPKRADISGL